MSIDKPGSHISQDDEFHGSMHETIYKLYDTIPEAVKELNAGFNALRKHNLSSSECAQVSVNFKKCLDKIADFVRPEDKDLLETTFMENPACLRRLNYSAVSRVHPYSMAAHRKLPCEQKKFGRILASKQ